LYYLGSNDFSKTPSNTNFFSSSPMCETVSQQENRPLSFRYEVCFFVKSQDGKEIACGPFIIFFENGQQ